MLANHFQNGIETARLVWSRIPNSDESQLLDDAVGILKKNDGGGVESLDYEVIENFAYREEQVLLFSFNCYSDLLIFLIIMLLHYKMIFCRALWFLGAEREVVCELFACGEMVLRLAHWHLYVLQFNRGLKVLLLFRPFFLLRCSNFFFLSE